MPFVSREIGQAGGLAEARPSKLATGTRLQASKRPKLSEAEAEPGQTRPSWAELGWW